MPKLPALDVYTSFIFAAADSPVLEVGDLVLPAKNCSELNITVFVKIGKPNHCEFIQYCWIVCVTSNN